MLRLTFVLEIIVGYGKVTIATPFSKISNRQFSKLDTNRLVGIKNWSHEAQFYADLLYKSIEADQIVISFEQHKYQLSRHKLCHYLIQKYQDENDSFFQLPLTPRDCVKALKRPQKYESIVDWKAWEGYHVGQWVDNMYGSFDDSAYWAQPVNQTLPFSDRTGHSIKLSNFAFQSVQFNSPLRTRMNRYGWNISHPKMHYVLGFDRKNAEMTLMESTHIGFPFTRANAECLIWLTPKEVFLECIRNVSIQGKLERRRISTGSHGYGQWRVEQR